MRYALGVNWLISHSTHLKSHMDYSVTGPSLRCERLTSNRVHLRLAIFNPRICLNTIKSPFLAHRKHRAFVFKRPTDRPTDRPTG